MTVIGALKTYLAAYSGLKENAPLWVDFIGSDPTQYAIIPIPGAKILEQYLKGSLRTFPFAFQSVESTADELERLENNGFYEALSDWFESQSESLTLPTLGTGKTAESIEVLGWVFLYQEGQSSTGIYQVQCRLTYSQS